MPDCPFVLTFRIALDNHSQQEIPTMSCNACSAGVLLLQVLEGGKMRRGIVLTALLLTVLAARTSWSQSTNATVGGTVQDPTGAFIPGVNVTATNTGTGITTTVVTNEAGAYQLASLQPGTYEI